MGLKKVSWRLLHGTKQTSALAASLRRRCYLIHCELRLSTLTVTLRTFHIESLPLWLNLDSL